MKQLRTILLAAAALLLAAGCEPDAKYTVKKVGLSMEVVQTGCGFCEVKFHTTKDAYYYVAAEKVREGVDPFKISKQFMTLSLDYAYKEYINWRFDLLYNGTPHIADFSSHSLQYGDQDYFFTSLEEDKDYWIYAFVVDPTTNSPAGDLILKTVHTNATSRIKIGFSYRVNDVWDYVYPFVEGEYEIASHIPWVGATADSLYLRNEAAVTAPGRYFLNMFNDYRENNTGRILYGMYAHKNDGVGDGTSATKFEAGHTYYTALASFDGPLILEGEYRNYRIFKFKWAPGLQKTFDDEDDTQGAW